MNRKTIMANDGQNDMDMEKRMERMERDIADIKAALLGNVIDGNPGLLGRVREREGQAENHDLRIVRLETSLDTMAKQKDLDALEARVEHNREQLHQWKAQMQLLGWLAGGGGIGGIAALVWTLIQAFTGAGG